MALPARSRWLREQEKAQRPQRRLWGCAGAAGCLQLQRCWRWAEGSTSWHQRGARGPSCLLQLQSPKPPCYQQRRQNSRAPNLRRQRYWLQAVHWPWSPGPGAQPMLHPLQAPPRHCPLRGSARLPQSWRRHRPLTLQAAALPQEPRQPPPLQVGAARAAGAAGAGETPRHGGSALVPPAWVSPPCQGWQAEAPSQSPPQLWPCRWRRRPRHQLQEQSCPPPPPRPSQRLGPQGSLPAESATA